MDLTDFFKRWIVILRQRVNFDFGQIDKFYLSKFIKKLCKILRGDDYRLKWEIWKNINIL